MSNRIINAYIPAAGELPTECYTSLPEAVYCYWKTTAWNNALDYHTYCAFLGLAFGALFPEKDRLLTDSTRVTPLLLKILRSALALMGCEERCELIEKLGGVYNENYHKRRIMENIYLDKPVIAAEILPDERWSLIVGYEGRCDSILVQTTNGTIKKVNNWYHYISGMLLLGRPSDSCICSETIHRIFGLAWQLWNTHMPGYFCGRDAFDHLCQLYEIKCVDNHNIVNFFLETRVRRRQAVSFLLQIGESAGFEKIIGLLEVEIQILNQLIGLYKTKSAKPDHTLKRTLIERLRETEQAVAVLCGEIYETV